MVAPRYLSQLPITAPKETAVAPNLSITQGECNFMMEQVACVGNETTSKTKLL